MSEKRVRSLLHKSAKIQQEIDREHARPAPHNLTLIRLKKLRLKIKDHIMRIVAAHSANKQRASMRRRKTVQI